MDRGSATSRSIREEKGSHIMMSNMSELCGKKILAIFISDDQYRLFFKTDMGLLLYETGYECGSETWFSDILGVDSLIGGTVVSTEEVSMDGYNVDDGRCRQESDEAYGFKITTNKGMADIIFRNSSNGYYGGWLNFYAEAKLPANVVQILDDWNA